MAFQPHQPPGTPDSAASRRARSATSASASPPGTPLSRSTVSPGTPLSSVKSPPGTPQSSFRSPPGTPQSSVRSPPGTPQSRRKSPLKAPGTPVSQANSNNSHVRDKSEIPGTPSSRTSTHRPNVQSGRLGVPGTPESQLSSEPSRQSVTQKAVHLTSAGRWSLGERLSSNREPVQSNVSVSGRSQPQTPDSKNNATAQRQIPGTPQTPESARGRRPLNLNAINQMLSQNPDSQTEVNIPGTPNSAITSHSRQVRHEQERADTGEGNNHAPPLDGDISQAVIWGTDVCVDDIISRFKEFILEFTENEHEFEPHYIQKT